MSPHSKQSYHPYLLIAFYLQCLPDEICLQIPRSTRHDWRHKDLTPLFGYDYACQNEQFFQTLKNIAASQRLLRVNRALLRLIALRRFISRNQSRIIDNIPPVREVVLNTLQKITSTLSLSFALKCLQQSHHWVSHLRQKQRCPSSLFDLCRIKHPNQLLVKEINAIKAYCSDTRFLYWPLSSIYHQLMRDKAALFSIATFYKYVSLLGLKRHHPASGGKTIAGIRSSAPLQLLHADCTIFRTADNQKHYIYLVQDNYSRAILSYWIAQTCEARFTLENLQEVQQRYLIPAGIEKSTLLTDDGSENAGPVKQLIRQSTNPFLTHLIAQKDITFSNSMIEAVNKQLKYQFLYHQHIPDGAALDKFVPLAIDDYHNRPNNILKGLTPTEALQGQQADSVLVHHQISQASKERTARNKSNRCCYYTF